MLTVFVTYGHKPVRPRDPREPLRLAFDGRRGDRVDLVTKRVCAGDRVALLASGGKVARRADGLFRLPSRGRYVFDWRPCATSSEPLALQLTRYLVKPVKLDGRVTRIARVSRGLVKAARIRVPATGYVRVATDRRVLTRSQTGVLAKVPRVTYYEAGQPVVDEALRRRGDDALRVGQRLLLLPVPAQTKVRALTGVVVPVGLDGPAVSLPVGSNGGLDRLYEFPGAAGDWVHVELGGAIRGYFPALGGEHPVADPWFDGGSEYQLTGSGVYRLGISGWSPDPQSSGSVQVQRIRQAGPIPTDGSPVTVSASQPGEIVMASFTRDTVGAPDLAVLASTTAGAWWARANTLQSICRDPWGPLDCGRASSVAVWPEGPSADGETPPWADYRGDWALFVRFAPDHSGTLTLAVSN